VGCARPAPPRPAHPPGAGWPGPAGPATWLSPVRACRISTALEPSYVPQVSYAMVTSSMHDPLSSGKDPIRQNFLSPDASDSRHAPDGRQSDGEGGVDIEMKSKR